MRILYVTPMWSGLRDLLIEGKTETGGMPAFIKPLEYFALNNMDIELFVGTAEKKFNIKCEWLKNIKITAALYRRKNICKYIHIFISFLRVFLKIASNKYDFIYCHGSYGSIGIFAAKLLGIPCGQRLYGTFLFLEINRPKWKIMLRHPLEYYAFTSKKDFLMVTNDGTKGDVVYKRLNGHLRSNFYFVFNGVDAFFSNSSATMPNVELPYLFYPARIDRWKQQHLAINLLNRINLERRGLHITLYLAGHITDKEYWDELEGEVKKNSLQKQVVYLGVLPSGAMPLLLHKALAVLSFYKYSNLGNVAIETLRSGGLLISLNDESLSSVITSGKEGILVDNISEAANCIIKLLDKPTEGEMIKKNAQNKALHFFKSWHERIQDEQKIIMDSLKSNK